VQLRRADDSRVGPGLRRGEDQHYSTDHCAGTAAATPALIAEVELLTGAGRPPYDVPGGLPDDTASMGVFADVDRWQVVMVGAGWCS
jgi:hypothetical protein